MSFPDCVQFPAELAFPEQQREPKPISQFTSSSESGKVAQVKLNIVTGEPTG